MRSHRHRSAATNLLVAAAAALWGLYWLPVRALAEWAPGAWGTVVVVAVAALVLAPVGVVRRRELFRAGGVALAATALGGASFALYSLAVVEGRVAAVILLFYLTPVWSTLIGRLWLGWPTAGLRYVALGLGLAGLGLVLGADGEAPLPQSAADWLGLLSGLLWSFATTGIRTRSRLAADAAAFVFALGGLATALALTPLLAAAPAAPPAPPGPAAWVWVGLAAGLWWGLSLMVLLWAATRIEPARLGMLQMSEVVVGVVSAALLAGEALGPATAIGGGLIVAAAVLEVWPVHARAEPGAPTGA
ncbi:MAG: EamA family transporter [Alphaproteobacteria bacterium]